MSVKRIWIAGLSCFLATVFLLTGCMAPAARTAPASSPAVVPADSPGAVDALIRLRDEFKAGAGFSSQDSAELRQRRDEMAKRLADISGKVNDGLYQDALDALEKDIAVKAADLVISTCRDKVASSTQTAIQSIKTASITTVTTKCGRLAGSAGRGISYAWKGVPYASPPVGDLRWRAPREPLPWSGVRHSTDNFSIATQLTVGKTWRPTGRIEGSEDCLYLNIWRPQSEEKNLPVYVWIHGGGNNFGAAMLYDGAALASVSNMMVVVIQYRLGPFGWFSHPALKQGVSPEEASGNYGTLDTIQALKWVKENISAFGGDPGVVTVAGQSAGGHNVMNLLVSPLAKGLFHRAIGQSGGMAVQPVSKGTDMANATIDKLLFTDGRAPDLIAAAACRKAMSDADIAGYLRSKSAEDIIRAQINSRGSIEFHPAYADGVVIPGDWKEVILSGNYNEVPVMLGSNSDEVKNFLPLFGGAMPTSNGHHWSDLYSVLDGNMTLDEVMPLKFDKDIYQACGYYASRNFKARFVDSNARVLRDKQDNVYCYLFNWGGMGSGPSPYDFIFGAAHAVEIPFFFGWPRDTFGYAFTAQNRDGRVQLQKAMMSYMKQFAVTGNPNVQGGSLPSWKPWSNEAGGPKCIVFDSDFTDAKINMMAEEVTRDDVISQADKLSEPTRAMVRLWLQ